MQYDIYNLLVEKDEVTWQTILMDLIKNEQMNPWDINISLLTKRYIETLQHLKEANFYVSGKMILAAALLLKVKSEKLVDEDISNFDALLYPQEEALDFEELVNVPGPERNPEKPQLTIRTPMPRKRKVSIEDLMSALKKALEVNQRRIVRHEAAKHVDVVMPEKKIDIGDLIKEVYQKITGFFTLNALGKLTFTQLLPSQEREAKILTFIPLLHLANEEKIDLQQEEHFGEIRILLKQEMKAPQPERVKVPEPEAA